MKVWLLFERQEHGSALWGIYATFQAAYEERRRVEAHYNSTDRKKFTIVRWEVEGCD